MLPDATLSVPASLAALFAAFAPVFTAPTFRTFCGLAAGFLSQTGNRTVCGMLTGAGLSRSWSHDRAHGFFARARWDPGELGAATARLVVSLLVPGREPVLVAIDDTLFKRRGKKVWAVSWFRDGSAHGRARAGFGNNWVIAAIVVRVPFTGRPVALPVTARLSVKGSGITRLMLARQMAADIAAALPGRKVHVVADSAYAGAELRKLPDGVTWTTRLRKDAALYALPPARTGRPGRPRVKGDKLPALKDLAAAAWAPVTVTRYGTTATIHAAVIDCLWYKVFGARPVTVILIRDRSARGCDLALLTTAAGPAATPAAVIERYAARWSIEVAIEDAKQVHGAGQARNRTRRAVERTLPFQLTCQTLTTCWYHAAGHDPADTAARRAAAPWYPGKTQPSTADMTAKLRRVLIAARYRPPHPRKPTREEISTICLAWETPAA